MKIVIVGSQAESLLNFRGDLIKALVKNNNKVIGMSPEAPNEVNIIEKLQKIGAEYRPYSISRNGLSVANDIKTWLSLRKEFKQLQPNIILAYFIKPIIWGGLASRVLPQTHFYAMVEGLGFAFQGTGLLRKTLKHIVTSLYKHSLKNASAVIFLNKDDLNKFVSYNIIPENKTRLINGIGVNLKHYPYTPMPDSKTTFLAIGRLLGEKGFREYAQAAKIVKEKYPETNFQILGPTDTSPNAIPIDEVNLWHKNNWIEYLGSTDDVRPYIKQSHIFVLPSYYGEGLPRTILEAMAIGRPILTTDNVGCRETVVSGENGFLVLKANVQALVERMIWFIKNRAQWQKMGNRSRELAEERYDVHKINQQIIQIMQEKTTK